MALAAELSHFMSFSRMYLLPVLRMYPIPSLPFSSTKPRLSISEPTFVSYAFQRKNYTEYQEGRLFFSITGDALNYVEQTGNAACTSTLWLV